METSTWVAMSESNNASIRISGLAYLLASSALMAIIAFADTGPLQFPLLAMVVGTAMYGIMSFEFGMQNGLGLRASMPGEIADTQIGKDAEKAPFTRFRITNFGLVTLVAVGQITVLF